MFAPMDAVLLLQLCLFAVGLGWVVTGSKIGRVVRVCGYAATRWLPGRPLTSLFFCPPCNTWWMGVGVAFWARLPWYNVLQVAFSASVLMAILNLWLSMDADDLVEIEERFGDFSVPPPPAPLDGGEEDKDD